MWRIKQQIKNVETKKNIRLVSVRRAVNNILQAGGKGKKQKTRENKSKQIFTIYTTAIGFVEESGKGMIDGWENLLTSILTSIPNNYKIKIIHYTPRNANNIIEKTAGIDRKICKDRLLSTECHISFFPKRGLYNDENHILIDMAHLVSYSLVTYSSNQDDSGYKQYYRRFLVHFLTLGLLCTFS